MGIVELGNKLGISKGQASKLVAKGMPTHSVEAAHAWRDIHAKPRPSTQKGVRVESLRPPEPAAVQESEPEDESQTQGAQESLASAVQGEPPPPVITRDHTAPEPDDDNNDPRQSLRRARKAELVGFNELAQCKRNGGSIEDIRKANSIYIAARNNRYKAEKDFKEWQRSEGILLFFDEARDIVSRPHVAVKQTLDIMPKTLAPRLFNQPQKAIEQTLADWVDNLTAMIRAGI